ncbi:MAG: FKBP-type peptidyl-prolyl cis-trans isomerase [Nitrosopumilus sp.]|nr:FKBP-type peptidyl-prolyl cis-trans isomerase [Nitrosopumilus sp.]
MPFERNSLILVDYTARVKDTGEVFETTRGDVAREHLPDGDAGQGPRLVSIGGRSYPVLSGFGEALAGASVGESITVDIEPERGFGARDKKKVRMMPLRKLGDDAETAEAGDSVEVDGRKGVIRFVGSGRVQVDFNHRHAGKTLTFEGTVTAHLQSAEEKAGAILENKLQKGITFKLEGGGLEVEIPAEIAGADDLQTKKGMARADIFLFVPELESITYLEKHVNAKAARAAGAGGAGGQADPPQEHDHDHDHPHDHDHAHDHDHDHPHDHDHAHDHDHDRPPDGTPKQ